ncbi:hypothetical protein D3C80_1491890 [compost metagenome]
MERIRDPEPQPALCRLDHHIHLLIRAPQLIPTNGLCLAPCCRYNRISRNHAELVVVLDPFWRAGVEDADHGSLMADRDDDGQAEVVEPQHLDQLLNVLG